MKIVTTGLMLAALTALAACAGGPPSSGPSDVGSMALPSTGTAGVRVSEPTTRDVGSMSAPSGSGGVVSRTAPTTSAPDVGSMALPSNAQGNTTTRRY